MIFPRKLPKIFCGGDENPGRWPEAAEAEEAEEAEDVRGMRAAGSAGSAAGAPAWMSQKYQDGLAAEAGGAAARGERRPH
jgi:beta-galactosidase GanA